MSDDTYSITDLAQEFGITTRTIRFYEDHGLLSPARSGRNRVYGKRDRVRLKLTLRGKRLGLSLTEIRELLDMYDEPRDGHPQLARFLSVLAKRRAELEQQREDIEAALGEIRELEARCRGALDGRTHARARPASPRRERTDRKLTLT